MTEPFRAPSAAQPPSAGRRRCPAEALALVAVLFVMGVLGTIYAWLHQTWFRSSQDILDTGMVSGIVSRGSSLIGLPQPSTAWQARLLSGEASLADYLLRLFVSPEYLAGNPDDPAFIRDASQVLTGRSPDPADSAAAMSRLTAAGSRLAYLNELLADAGLTDRIRLPAEATRLRTLTLANDRPAAGSEVVGLLPVTAEVRLTGGNASLKLFADGQLRRSEPADRTDPTLLNTYALEWDTRQEQPGRYSLAFLILTGDGRGSWQDLSSYIVPTVTPLQSGQVLSIRQPGNGTAWYRLPVRDGQARLTVVGADQPLSLRLQNLHREILSTAEGLSGQTAALRGRTADPESYVCVTAGTASSYRLAAAPAAAAPLKEPNRLLGVLEIKDQKILIQDEQGGQTWQNASQYKLYDPTGRLARLALTLPDGTPAAMAGKFDAEDTRYGLYVDPTTSQLRLSAVAMEGSAAALRIELTTETGGTQILQAGQTVPLALSVNRLRLTVTAFNGSRRTYEVSILRPPHSGGYDNTLQQFPPAYRSPLWLLHDLYPAWQFLAAPAGVAWPDFIAAQDYKDRSLVSASDSPATWIEPGSPVYDGKSWKAATTQVIAYFADPRNFLNSTDVFQFEKLTYNPATHTRTGLDTMLQGTFMAAGNAQGIDYAAILAEAGNRAGVSPYYLASRILQEMGRNGVSALATGTLANYEGYFNFYNIGSTPDTSVPNGMVINGARFAKYGREPDKGVITADEEAWLLPWTSPAKSIIGGAIWIARSYIQIGQDTLYLQKFDLVKAGGYYNHQYATNIQMAWSEARNTRQGYSDMGILAQAFVFQIPVFADLPAAETKLP